MHWKIVYYSLPLSLPLLLPLSRHQVNMTSVGKEKEKENPSIRFKIHYHVITIQPLRVYDDFLKVRTQSWVG